MTAKAWSNEAVTIMLVPGDDPRFEIMWIGQDDDTVSGVGDGHRDM